MGFIMGFDMGARWAQATMGPGAHPVGPLGFFMSAWGTLLKLNIQGEARVDCSITLCSGTVSLELNLGIPGYSRSADAADRVSSTTALDIASLRTWGQDDVS